MLYMNSTRFGRPVSGSKNACRASWFSNALRSVTSRALMTMPPNRRMVQQVGADRFEVAPGAVLVPAAEVQHRLPGRVGGAGGERRRHPRDVFRVDQVEHTGPGEHIGRVTEHPFEGRAVPEDQAIWPEDRHHVGAVLHQGAEAILALAERRFDLLPGRDVAGNDDQVGVAADAERGQANLDVDTAPIMVEDRRFEVGDGLAVGRAPWICWTICSRSSGTTMSSKLGSISSSSSE